MIARGSGRPQAAPAFGKGRLLRGVNLHHRKTVFAQPFRPGGFAQLQTTELDAGFVERFRERFDGLDSLGPRGCLSPEFASRLGSVRGVSLVEALLEAIVAVERTAACTMRRLDGPEFARVVDTDDVTFLVWEAHSASLSRIAARVALAGLLELLPEDLVARPEERASSFARQLAGLRKRSRRRQWSTATAVLAYAARQRGLPCEPLAGNYLRLGDGITQSVISESVLGGPEIYENPDGRAGASDQKALHRVLVIDGEIVSVLRPDEQDPVDLTDRLHPGARALLLDQVARHGLRIAGVDYYTANVARAPGGGHGRVGTIRAQPELLGHVTGDPVRRARVARAALDLAFPAGAEGHIPTILVTGPRGTRVVTRDLDRYLRIGGLAVGTTSRAGSTILGKPVHRTSAGRRVGPEFLLRDPRVGALVVAASPRHVVREGLRLDSVSLTAILDPTSDTDLENYRAGVGVCLSATPRSGPVILGVGNPETPALLSRLDPRAVILVSHGGDAPLLARHLADGGGVVRPVRDSTPPRIELAFRTGTVASTVADSLRSGAGRLDAPRWKRLCFTAALALAFPMAEGRAPGVPLTLPKN